MSENSPEEKISRILRAISSPSRILILYAIGAGEACVCHLEAKLGMRQAYISQQLMEMRDAGLLDTRREGRFIFYRLTEPQFVNVLIDISRLFDVPAKDMEALLNTGPLSQCCCPDCSAGQDSPLISDIEITS